MDQLAQLAAKVAEMERRMSGMFRHGTVAQVDTAKHRIRMNLGQSDDGSPMLSPWIPYGQQAGALSVHTPPSVGQQMTMMAPDGDPQQAVAMPMTWSNQNQSPSNSASENVIRYGGVTIKLTAGGIEITGGTIKHNGKNVGSDHVHNGIEPGGGNTGAPQA